MPDTSWRITFEHDGHRFDAAGAARPGSAEPEVHWVVRMDGAPALEFRGPYPYRDEDVRKRVLEWYAIQRPRPAGVSRPPASDSVTSTTP